MSANIRREYVEDRDTYTLIVDGMAMGTVDTTRDHTGDVLARRASGEIVAPRFISTTDAETYLMGGDRPSLCVNDGSCIRATGHNGEHQDSTGRVWGRALPIRTEVRRDGIVGTVVSTHGPSRGLRNGEVYVSWSGGSAWRSPEVVNVESLTKERQNFAVIETASGKVHACLLADDGSVGNPLCGATYKTAHMFAIVGSRKGVSATFCAGCRAALPESE